MSETTAETTASVATGAVDSDLDRRFATFEQRLAAIESRLAAVESGPRAAAARPAPAPDRAIAPRHDEADHRTDIALTGRSLIAIGGAYLLRALTESNVLPRSAGVLLGLTYALIWIGIADRHGARARRHSAVFAALVAAMIAYPLIWESTVRFQTMSVGLASVLLLSTTLLLLALAVRRDLATAAWAAVLGSFGCTAALSAASELPSSPFVAFALGGALTWHLATRRSWAGVGWPAVAGAWVIAIPLEIIVAARRSSEPPELVTAALLIVAFAYLGAVAAKNLLSREEIAVSDILQAAGTAIFILAGTAWLSTALPRLTSPFSVAIGAVAAGAYLTSLRQPPEDTRAAVYFGGVGLVFALTATAIRFPRPVAGLVWIALAFCAVLISHRVRPRSNEPLELDRVASLRLEALGHAAVYAVAGMIATRLLPAEITSITGIGGSPAFGGPAIGAAIALIGLAAYARIVRPATLAPMGRTIRIALFAMASLSVVAGAATVAVRLLAAEPGTGAAIRSAVIALAALGLALLSRIAFFSNLGRLVYPMLGLGAAKFIVDDAMKGRAVTLFVALALYGGTLVVLARLRRPAALEAADRGTP